MKFTKNHLISLNSTKFHQKRRTPPRGPPGRGRLGPRFIYIQSVNTSNVLKICKDYVGFLRFLDFQESQNPPIFRPFRAPPGPLPGGPKVRKSPKSLNCQLWLVYFGDNNLIFFCGKNPQNFGVVQWSEYMCGGVALFLNQNETQK